MAKPWLVTAFLAALTVGAAAQDRSLVVASTTSVEDSGLFDHLLPLFTQRTGISVRIVSRGSAEALMTAERGTIDLVIVNDPGALDRFVAAGQGVQRRAIMTNRFVIVGPANDPAQIRGMTDAAEALRQIARVRAAFVSRGDNSGTHTAEMHLWRIANVNPKTRSGGWYRETGLGMGHTVQMAARLKAYVLTDRATWVKLADGRNEILLDGDARLVNPYEIAMVDPVKHPHVNVATATAFIDWLLSDDGRGAIASYRVNDEPMFVPTPALMN